MPFATGHYHPCYPCVGESAGQSLRFTGNSAAGRKVRAPVDKVPGNAWEA